VSRSLGPALPPDLLQALSQDDLGTQLGRALPFITLDAAGRPHPMLLSHAEVRAVSPRTIRVAVGADGSGARNLAERHAATLLVVGPERTVYVKCRATGPPLVAPPLARFTLEVADVLEDFAAEWEGGARITAGIAYAPVLPLDAPQVRATLALLARDAPPPSG
jgi:hypothetical protein